MFGVFRPLAPSAWKEYASKTHTPLELSFFYFHKRTGRLENRAMMQRAKGSGVQVDMLNRRFRSTGGNRRRTFAPGFSILLN